MKRSARAVAAVGIGICNSRHSRYPVVPAIPAPGALASQAKTGSRSVSYSPEWLRKMSLSPPRTVMEFSAWLLISVCASSAPMMALSSQVFRSGELANCSLLLLLACWRSVCDSSSLPLSTLFT